MNENKISDEISLDEEQFITYPDKILDEKCTFHFKNKKKQYKLNFSTKKSKKRFEHYSQFGISNN